MHLFLFERVHSQRFEFFHVLCVRWPDMAVYMRIPVFAGFQVFIFFSFFVFFSFRKSADRRVLTAEHLKVWFVRSDLFDNIPESRSQALFNHRMIKGHCQYFSG